MTRRLLVAFGAGAALGAVFCATPVMATHQVCACSESICSADGFEKTLIDHHVDQLNGVSMWDYEVCNQAKGRKVCAPGECVDGGKAGFGCSSDADCPGGSCDTATGGGGGGATGDECTDDAECTGECVPCAPPRDLSHVDFVLPGIGECVSATAAISIAQLGCPLCDPVLTCSVSDRDPSCPAQLCAPGSGGRFCSNAPLTPCTRNADCPGGSCSSVPCAPISSPSPLKVLKCDVSSGNLDPGECVKMRVTIAGEQPTIGPGTVDEVTKASTQCTSERLCGPACNCEPPSNECLTRTAGFWGTHPAITDLFDPITVCGKTLNTTASGVCNSDTEALCVSPGTEGNRRCDRNPAYTQLVRQLAAAKLNLSATAANGGDCGSEIAARIAECEARCGASQSAISSSGCIEDLDAFNNSLDTFSITPAPFDNPGPADPTQCTTANGNGLVIGKRCGTFDCR
jgi:hypothetical protein